MYLKQLTDVKSISITVSQPAEATALASSHVIKGLQVNKCFISQNLELMIRWPPTLKPADAEGRSFP